MTKKLFAVFGVSLCLLLGYGNYSGVNVVDAVTTGEWSPTGAKPRVGSGGRTHFYYYGGGYHHK